MSQPHITLKRQLRRLDPNPKGHLQAPLPISHPIILPISTPPLIRYHIPQHSSNNQHRLGRPLRQHSTNRFHHITLSFPKCERHTVDRRLDNFQLHLPSNSQRENRNIRYSRNKYSLDTSNQTGIAQYSKTYPSTSQPSHKPTPRTNS